MHLRLLWQEEHWQKGNKAVKVVTWHVLLSSDVIRVTAGRSQLRVLPGHQCTVHDCILS